MIDKMVDNCYVVIQSVVKLVMVNVRDVLYGIY